MGYLDQGGSSLTYLEWQRDGSCGAKHIAAKLIGECWRKRTAQVHLRGMQQEGKLCTPLSSRGRGLQRLQSSTEVGL